MMITAAIVCVLLYYNFQFEAGQLVEPCLVQTRNVSKVLHLALHGKYVYSFVLVLNDR